MVKQRIKTKSYKISQGCKFVQPTGEYIEIDNGSFTITEQIITDKHIISSANYNYLDTDALRKLMNLRTSISLQNAVGFLVALSDNLDFTTNIVLDEKGVPYTAKSIATLMQCTVKSVYNKLQILEYNKLISIYKSDLNQFKNKKVISINPTVLRRGKEFYSSLVKKFPDLALVLPNETSSKNEVLYKNRGVY